MSDLVQTKENAQNDSFVFKGNQLTRLNLSKLKSITGADQIFIIEILGLLQKQSHEFIEQIQTSLENKNYARLEEVAHKFKSSVQVLGESELFRQVRGLELSSINIREKGHDLVAKHVSNCLLECEVLGLQLEYELKQLN